MAVDKINVWHDDRVQKRSAHLNGRTYGYLYATPPTKPKGTIFLIHGFPDLSMGWRYQIPLFLSLGLRVVAPDCMGYGRTDAPPDAISAYSFRRISADLALLASQLDAPRIILGGHDWGGAIVYRFAQYYPTLVTHVFSICTPFFPPQPAYMPHALLVERKLPNFRYQLHFASGELEERIQSKEEIKAFLNGMYGGRGPGGEVAFKAEKGVFLENLGKLKKTPLLGEEELEYYASEYVRHGLHGPLNWYRNREVNFVEELEWFFGGVDGKGTKRETIVQQPVLFVLATKDTALKPSMAEKMGERIPRFRRREVKAGHWALWERSEKCSEIIQSWMEEVVFKDLEKGMSSKL